MQILGEQPLAPEGRAVYDAGKKIAAALPVLQAFAEEVVAGGIGFLDDLVSGAPDRLANKSPLTQDIGAIAGGILGDVLESLTGIDAETRGRIVGFVLYTIAEAMATAGAGAALKAGAACKAAQALAKCELLKNYPKVIAALQKSIDLIAATLRIDICFVAGTPVHTPRGVVPIESIRVDDTIWTRPEHGADPAKVIRRVTELAVTHPIELLALTLKTPLGVETLRCTLGHPFFEIGRGTFIAAEGLAVGDRLSLAGDGAATVVGIALEEALPGERFTTYNVAVVDCHTYFVGRAAVWAHNAGGICSELSTVYRKALRKSGKGEEAAEAVIDKLAEMLKKPGADLKKIEAEIAKSKIPGLTPKELLERARARNNVATNTGWVRPKGWRLPKNGTWDGVPGHSDFKPRNPAELGLKPNEVIPFREGHSNLSRWSKGNFTAKSPLTGVHETDMPLMVKTIAEAKGWTQSQVKDWLRHERLTPHHAGGKEIQLIPWDLHGNPSAIPPIQGVRHMGGAFDLRNLE